MNGKAVRELTKELSVLYAEDEEAARNEVAGILSSLFREVTVARDGEEGLSLYEKGEGFDLVVADIQMPRMNGLTMLEKIREIDKSQKAVIVSAHNDIDHFSRAIHIGVDGFIVKPLELDQLYATLNKVGEAIYGRQVLETYQEELEREVRERTLQLERQIVTDELTGLWNRTKFVLDTGGREHSVVMVLNMDNFDHVNTSYGYQVGDKLLVQLAELLKANVPEGASLYRLAGNEFALLCVHTDDGLVEGMARKLNHLIQEHPFAVGELEVSLTATIGVARGHGEDAVLHAHTALRESRALGYNRYEIYRGSSPLEEKQKTNLEWAQKVKYALKEGAIIPYFQPIIDNRTGKAVKYECLARMMEEGKVVSPGYFIEPARLIGLLPRITRTMIEKSCAYFGPRTEEFAINITELDLREGYMPTFLDEVTAKYGVARHRVTLEILENISAEGTGDALAQLRAFREMGFVIALDDFGSEKSNFHRLQELEVEFIKIDGAYIKNLDTNPNSYKIVETITRFAHSIDAKVVAEFVHSEPIQRLVEALGIEYSQGFHFGPPVQYIE